MTESPKPNVIVMAEDDADDRLLVKDALAECHWNADIRFVENGEQLMDYLLHRGRFADPETAPRPGLVLLDLNMPRKDGREVLREMKANEEFRRIPVVVLTTSHADTDIERIYDLGASSFISKPVDFDSLVNLMALLGQYWFNAVALPVLK